MKKAISDNIKTVLILLPVVILTRMIESLPWWSFVIPVLGLGIVITLKKWNVTCFLVGFLSGFIIWLGADLYFEMTFHGTILNKMGPVMKIIILLISAVIGGVLTGLSLYAGKSIVIDKTAKLTL